MKRSTHVIKAYLCAVIKDQRVGLIRKIWDTTEIISDCVLQGVWLCSNEPVSTLTYLLSMWYKWRLRWPRGLRRGSAAASLLGLRVRIPLGTWISVYCECLCCQVQVSASGRSLVQRSPTECCVSVCDPEASIMWSLWSIRGCNARKKVV
jgi:hypothetical protein